MSSDSTPGSGEGTRIDLGEDLLSEPTRAFTLERPNSTPDSVPPSSPRDQWESAKILFNEGFVEESKRALHQILIHDPSHVEARRKLQEIHELELKQIFSNEVARPRPLQRGSKASVEVKAWEVDRIIQDLDRDLKLGMSGLSLFQDDDALDRYADQIDQEQSVLDIQGRTDLGIAFLEMELYRVATRQFERALALASEQEPVDSQSVVAVTALLAYSHLLDGRAFESAAVLQPVLKDQEILESSKVEVLYLMGRACEQQGKRELARAWYRKVLELSPSYRDAMDRLEQPV